MMSRVNWHEKADEGQFDVQDVIQMVIGVRRVVKYTLETHSERRLYVVFEACLRICCADVQACVGVGTGRRQDDI